MENQKEIKQKECIDFDNWIRFIAQRVEEKTDTDIEFERRVKQLKISLNITDDNNN